MCNSNKGNDSEKQSKETVPEKGAVKKPTNWFGVRHTQVLLLYTMILIAYNTRASMSVAIVAMTDPTTNPDHDFPTYNWTNTSTILSSFFWGYVFLQVPFCFMVGKLGAKWILAASIAISSIFVLLTPLMADLGSGGVIFCRVLQGFSQGVIFPAMHHLMGRWVPPSERSALGTFIYLGAASGTVTAMPFTGWVSGNFLGWPTAFYVPGALGFVWVLFWVLFGNNSPAECKRIDPSEREYIEASLGVYENDKNHSTPWKYLMTSVAFWTLLTTFCLHSWNFFVILTEMPTFLNFVLQFDIKSNGILSACPYLMEIVVGSGLGCFIDFIINRRWVSRTVARKIATSIGMFGSSIMLVFLGFFVKNENDKILAVCLLIASVGFGSGTLSGVSINHIDLSPRHAGMLMAITNTVATVVSFLAPLGVELIVTDNTNTNQWKIVFFIGAALSITGAVLFCFFGVAKVQFWDNLEKPEKEEPKSEKVI